MVIIQEWLEHFSLEREENHDSYYRAMAALFIIVALGCALYVIRHLTRAVSKPNTSQKPS